MDELFFSLPFNIVHEMGDPTPGAHGNWAGKKGTGLAKRGGTNHRQRNFHDFWSHRPYLEQILTWKLILKSILLQLLKKLTQIVKN